MLFRSLEEGVDGLVHISDLSWSKKIKHPSEFCKVGDKMDVVVLEIDAENRRLSLGHKQLEDNPWDIFETVFTIGSKHKGTVTSINEKGATISLTYGVEGFCPNRLVGKEDKTNPKVDEQLDFIVTEFSKDAKRIVVSHRAVWDAEKEAQLKAEKEAKKSDQEESKKAVKKVKDNVEKTTLGDIESLAALKDKLDNK